MNNLEKVARAIRALTYEEQMTMAADLTESFATMVSENEDALSDHQEVASAINGWAQVCLEIIENEKPLA